MRKLQSSLPGLHRSIRGFYNSDSGFKISNDAFIAWFTFYLKTVRKNTLLSLKREYYSVLEYLPRMSL